MIRESQRKHQKRVEQLLEESNLEQATFGAGCFWGIEYNFARMDGVEETAVGYCGGETRYPTYREVCSGTTGHAEVVEVLFDPDVISYEKLVRAFFEMHDPTTPNRQGPDIGSQYRSAIFYHSEEQKRIAVEITDELNRGTDHKNPIITEIVAAQTFYRAEEYHQKYSFKNKQHACG